MSKKSLSVEEQIQYLICNKNIIIDDLNATKNLLNEIGYINLISPYKHYFHCGKKNNKHIYLNTTIFSTYIEKYKNDKETTMFIRENIFEYEKIIKTYIGNALSLKYSSCSKTEEIKKEIVKDLKKVITTLEKEEDNAKAKIKLQYLRNLKNKFDESNEYYLIMNKLQFGELRSFLDIIPVKFQSNELKYFFTNGDTLRIIRNNISHSSFIEVYLNNLDKKLLKRNINALKRIEEKVIFSKEVDYNKLYNSYAKFNKKIHK